MYSILFLFKIVILIVISIGQASSRMHCVTSLFKFFFQLVSDIVVFDLFTVELNAHFLILWNSVNNIFIFKSFLFRNANFSMAWNGMTDFILIVFSENGLVLQEVNFNGRSSFDSLFPLWCMHGFVIVCCSNLSSVMISCTCSFLNS